MVGCRGPSTARTDAPESGAKEKSRAAPVGMTEKRTPRAQPGMAVPQVPQEDRLKPALLGGGEEYNCGHGQQTDCTDIAGDGFAFAD